MIAFNNYFKFDLNDLDCNGIISVDFIFATLVILIIIGSIASIIDERMDAVSSTEEFSNGRMALEYVAESINMVYSGGNGQSTVISLPRVINNDNYEIRVNSSGVFILLGGVIGRSYINPKKITYTDRLIQSSVWMPANHKYLIKNVADSNNNTWIVILEIN